MATILRNYLGGTYQPSASDELIDSLNPSDTADVVARVPVGTVADAQAAAAAAHAALDAWRGTSGPDRGEHLHRWAGVVDGRREELARALAREVGKPIGEARGEIGRAVVILRYYAGEAVRAVGEVVPAASADALQFTLHDPLGVVALVTPWNFPVAIPLWKAAPAMAFGNTVVLKPAEQSSHMAHLLAESAAAAGIPPGVFNVLHGAGATVGESLLRADPVRAISFTGSIGVGARVAAIAAERNIRYQTEMGGKNVVIVLADADLDRAARLTAAGAMRFAGQKCTATSRAVVAREVEEAFLERLTAHVAQLTLGDVAQEDTAVGPLITSGARERVLAALRGSEGRAVCGGRAPADRRFAGGFYVEPTIIRDADPEEPLAQEEIFGPVLVTHTVSDVDHAIDVANRTRYGLSASLFTRDLGAALHYVRRIEAGLVRVNGDTTGVDPHAPFGGLKASSSGTREQGRAARDFYTEIRTVQVNP